METDGWLSRQSVRIVEKVITPIVYRDYVEYTQEMENYIRVPLDIVLRDSHERLFKNVIKHIKVEEITDRSISRNRRFSSKLVIYDQSN